jgi:hypothetical protein
MRKFLSRLAVVMVLLSPLAANAQDALLDRIAKAMGAAGVKSIQYTGSGVNFQVGQNYSPPPPAANPSSVNLADNIERLNLAVDQVLPLHGRIVPLAELHKAIGHAH